MNLGSQFRNALMEGALEMPFPGGGQTVVRHRRLSEIARENLALGRLAEAHVDALAILHEAGRPPDPNALYGVWASEVPGRSLRLTECGSSFELSGQKMFCTGATLVDRALITVMEPERRLVEVDLHSSAGKIRYDESEWVTSAFAETHTATATFERVPVIAGDFIGAPGWYLERPGFWHGACGPASCWAGGALGLLDYARANTREGNPHALAALGAIEAHCWALQKILDGAGSEIDANPDHAAGALRIALTVRHLVDEACTEILRRFGRAYGPRPLAFDSAISNRCQELTLYVRQTHAESDLELLGGASARSNPRP
jgi:alkylation response protein AidB-like acyl-CoA dehydrogenase